MSTVGSANIFVQSEMHELPSSPMWKMPVWLIALAAVFFGILGFSAYGHGTVPGDESILRWVQRAPPVPWQTIADFGNLLGETAIFPIVLIGLGLLSLLRKSTTYMVFCLSLLSLRILGMFLKSIFDSPRPSASAAELRDIFDNTGFPSGHAQTATVVAAAFSIVLSRLVPANYLVKAVIALIWIWAAACGFARIWYGAHWPSDVLGSFLIAIVFVGLSTHIASAFDKSTGESTFDR